MCFLGIAQTAIGPTLLRFFGHFVAHILTIIMVKNNGWYSDGNIGNGSYSMKDCHKPFG